MQGGALILLSLFVSLCWGTYAAIQKWAMERVSSIHIVLIAWLIAYAAAAALYILWNRATVPRMFKTVWDRRTFGILFVATFLLSFIPYMLYLQLLKNNDSHLVVALISTVPLVTLALGFLALNERVTWWSFAGVVLIVVGVSLIGVHTTKFV